MSSAREVMDKQATAHPAETHLDKHGLQQERSHRSGLSDLVTRLDYAELIA